MENEQEKQPKVCGQPCEVYSRVVGYLRPVQQWNKGKQSEFYKRRVFDHVGSEEIPDIDINRAIDKRFEGSAGY